MQEPFVYKLKSDMCSVDFTGHWQPGSVLRAMQEAGEGHCRRLHLTFEELRRKGVAWVLTRAKVQMDDYPMLGQEVTVRTWPGKTRHTFFPRYFTFEADGREVGRASSLFVLLDLQTRKIALPSRLDGEVPAYDIPPALPFPGNIQNLEAEPSRVDYTPVYTDFDMNRHVNNTRYVDWFMNQFPYERHERAVVSELLVHYYFEVTPHEPVTFVTREEGGVCVTQGVHGERVCFAIEGKWRERP